MALTADRDTLRRDGVDFNYAMEESTTIFAGGLTCLNAAGYAVPGSVSATLKAVGVAQARVVNAGADGAASVPVKKGVFRFKNSTAGDLITIADINADCYIVDDETVAKTSDSSARSVAGKVVDVDAAGVWVKFS